MSSEHSREAANRIAMETTDEGNVLGRPRIAGTLVATGAILAVGLLYAAMATAPSQTDLVSPPKPIYDHQK
jgi:hypothetical protein